IFCFGALSEQGVRFVEEQDGITALRLLEYSAEVLLGFTDVFTHNSRQIDLECLELQLARDNLDRHGLSHSALSVKKHGKAVAKRKSLAESPIAANRPPMAYLRADLAKLRHGAWRQRDVLPGGSGDEPAGEGRELAVGLRIASLVEIIFL